MTGGGRDAPPPFDLTPFIELLGPTVVEHALRLVDEAPPLTAEQHAHLGPLFAYGVRAAREARQEQDPAA